MARSNFYWPLASGPVLNLPLIVWEAVFFTLTTVRYTSSACRKSSLVQRLGCRNSQATTKVSFFQRQSPARCWTNWGGGWLLVFLCDVLSWSDTAGWLASVPWCGGGAGCLLHSPIFFFVFLRTYPAPPWILGLENMNPPPTPRKDN